MTNQHADRVSIIDKAGLRLIGTITVGRYPEAVAAWRGKAYVANWFSGDISIVDLTTGDRFATVKIGEGPRSMAFAGPGEAQ